GVERTVIFTVVGGGSGGAGGTPAQTPPSRASLTTATAASGAPGATPTRPGGCGLRVLDGGRQPQPSPITASSTGASQPSASQRGASQRIPRLLRPREPPASRAEPASVRAGTARPAWGHRW